MNIHKEEISEDIKAVQKLLDEWNLPELKQIFADEEVSTRTLDCLEEDDKQLREIIPKFGMRKIFLSYLKKWKESRKNTNKDCEEEKSSLKSTINPLDISQNSFKQKAVSNAQQIINSNTISQKNNENGDITSNLKISVRPLNQKDIKQEETILKISSAYTLATNGTTSNKPKSPTTQQLIESLSKSEKISKARKKIPTFKINLGKIQKPKRKIKKIKYKPPSNLPTLNFKEYNGEELNIIELLMEKDDLYKEIFSYYEEHSSLNYKYRQELVDVLNLAVFERKIKKGPELRKVLNNFADQIIQCFPTEQKETYIESSGFKGKLCNKYHNFQRDLRCAKIQFN